MGRIINLDELLEEVRKARDESKTIALANGAFDLFGVGHLRYLRGAKELADVLVVAVNSDSSVRALKGKARPIVELEDRITIVAAMEPVDYAMPFDELTVENILRLIKPDILARGADITEETVEKEIVASYGGKVAVVGGPKDHSTSDFIKRLAEKE